MWHPKCFFYSKNLFIFEDLSIKGFKMHDIAELQNVEHCMMGLTALARFHSKTIIYEENQEDRNYRISDDFQDYLTGGAYSDNKVIANAIKIGLRIAEESENFGKNTVHFEDVSKKWYDAYKKGIEMSYISKSERNVISHSDLWNNNIMFRYDENEEPKQCVFVDYQVCRLSPPGADIMSYLYLNTSTQVRSQHMNFLLKHYYEELKKELLRKNIDINEIYPENSFIECCMRFKIWGLVHSIFLFQFILLNSKIADNILNDSQKKESSSGERLNDTVHYIMDKNSASRERMLSSVDEFISHYII